MPRRDPSKASKTGLSGRAGTWSRIHHLVSLSFPSPYAFPSPPLSLFLSLLLPQQNAASAAPGAADPPHKTAAAKPLAERAVTPPPYVPPTAAPPAPSGSRSPPTEAVVGGGRASAIGGGAVGAAASAIGGALSGGGGGSGGAGGGGGVVGGGSSGYESAEDHDKEGGGGRFEEEDEDAPPKVCESVTMSKSRRTEMRNQFLAVARRELFLVAARGGEERERVGGGCACVVGFEGKNVASTCPPVGCSSNFDLKSFPVLDVLNRHRSSWKICGPVKACEYGSCTLEACWGDPRFRPRYCARHKKQGHKLMVGASFTAAVDPWLLPRWFGIGSDRVERFAARVGGKDEEGHEAHLRSLCLPRRKKPSECLVSCVAFLSLPSIADAWRSWLNYPPLVFFRCCLFPGPRGGRGGGEGGLAGGPVPASGTLAVPGCGSPRRGHRTLETTASDTGVVGTEGGTV